MKLKKALAEAMARDVRAARRKILRRATPEETYVLMVLADDLEWHGHINWMGSLAEHYEQGRHHLGFHLGIEDPEEEREIADEIAADMRQLKEMAESDERSPITVERLREGEELLAKYGEKVILVDRLASGMDVSLN